jgi:hypothetical protein
MNFQFVKGHLSRNLTDSKFSHHHQAVSHSLPVKLRILLVCAHEVELPSLASDSSKQMCAGTSMAPNRPAKEDYGQPQEMRERRLYLPGPREREVLQRPLRRHREQKRD